MCGPWESTNPQVSHTEAERLLTGKKLADGEVTDSSVTTAVFPILFRIYRYPRFVWRITGASSPASRVARQRRIAASLSSPVMVSLGEHSYGIYKP